jgi:hypothetical protein
VSNKEAYAAAYMGRLQDAKISTQRAVEQALQVAQPERAGLWLAGAALREAFFGNALQAREKSIAALQHSNNREVEFGAALALAISGDDVRARAFADDLERRFPEDTIVRGSYSPVLRARIALNQGNAPLAIETLQGSVPYDLGSSRLLFGALYPPYMRGEALLAAKRGDEAAVQFQKVLDHRGIVVSDPIGALAHLQMGRAFALSGSKSSAEAAYKDFFRLWKDADHDLPLLKEAKVEYAKLLQ